MWSSAISTEQIYRMPGLDTICVAVPGRRIPIINQPVLVPVLWPTNRPAILPPYIDSLSIYRDDEPPYMDVLSTSGGVYLVSGQEVLAEIIPVSVNWPLLILRKREPISIQWCPVIETIKDTISKRKPINVIATTRLPLRENGIFVSVVSPQSEWPSLDMCPPCPLAAGRVYEKVRSYFRQFADKEYIRISIESGFIRCPMWG